MLTRLLVGCSLMAICVIIHAAGSTWALHRLRGTAIPRGFWPSTWLFVLVALWIVSCTVSRSLVGHCLRLERRDPGSPAVGDLLQRCDWTTTGYGDVVLPREWRLDAGMEALTGILMRGWSTGFSSRLSAHLYVPQPLTATRP